MKLAPSDVASIVLVSCALVLTALAVRRDLVQHPSLGEGFRKIPYSPELSLAGRALGPTTARATIIEFSDFQCPYCARAEAVLRAVRSKHADEVRILYRHLPIESLHPHARAAALASECAAAQDRFEEYHDLLFRFQDSIGPLPWDQFAGRAGVANIPEFRKCIAEERYADALERDVAAARALEVRGTPAFIIGEELFQGVPTLSQVENRIARELRRTR